ncbi:hypothetical protein F4X73_09275 [Candidatus Poribacteria bacterium]|nr:hypothetical protein [Candidatus Poribacteria bacterium]MYF55095.1 hypothetical protein [Candidatus Poribacteria bacterium]
MPQKEEVLRDYLHFIKKYTFVICMCTILVLGTALIISLRIPKTYSASTLLRLIQSNTSAPISSNNLFQTVLSGGVDRSEMATISKRFSTESMLNAAIENMDDNQLGALQHLPSIGILKRKLNAQIDPEADYIELSIKLTEDEGGERNAALLVNQLARDMQTLRSENEKTRLAKHQKFLENKRDEIDKKIRELIDETLDFVRENGSPETWYPQLASLLEQYRNLQERLGISELALHTTRGRLDHFKTRQDTLPQQTKISETQNKNPIWLYQQEKLIDLESQRIGDSEKAGKSTHELSGLEAQIKDIREQTENTSELITTTTYGTSAHYTYLENQLIELPPTIEGHKNETEQLRKELQKIQNQLQELLTKIPENQHTFTQLRTNIELAGTLKEEIEKRYLESEILSAESNVTPAQKGGIEIVDIAVPRKIAVSPQFKLIVVLAGVIGLCLGVTLALAIEFFQN